MSHMQGAYKKKIGVKEFYDAMVLSYRAVFHLLENSIKPKVDATFIERLMLAVTEVNGCEVCSYAHTRMALKSGFSREEIDSFLQGSDAFIVPDEATAILFAQHYADSRAKPDRQAYDRLVREYGKEKSRIIVSAIQVMMLGNVIGIPISALYSRMRGSPYPNSSLIYEIGMLLSGFLLLPISLAHALFRILFVRRNIRVS